MLEEKSIDNRYSFVIFLLGIFWLVIIGRVFSLQIRYNTYNRKVNTSAKIGRIDRGMRGCIYDRFYRLLAITIDSVRYYPFYESTHNLLGFIGKDIIGLEGVEYMFNSILKEKNGYIVLGRTPSGKIYPYPTYSRKFAKDGKNLVLTIDIELQELLYNVLKNRVNELSAENGSGIILNPKTGEILAMVTVKDYGERKVRNVPVQDEFEPGSIFKIVPISYIVSHNLVRLDSIVEDGSCQITVGNKVIHDVREHGPFTFAEAVYHSSNVAFVKLSRIIGKENFYKMAKLFGFGEKTGVKLPAESNGKISEPKYWDDLVFANLSFGQGVSATLLQIAFAYQSIANAGVLLKPIIVKEIFDENNIVNKCKVEIVRKVLPEEKAKEITDLLCGVVEKGSGRLASVEGIKIAGKTGTANKCKDGKYVNAYVSSFVCYFPADNPKYLVAIMIDEPKGPFLGGDVCCPPMKEIIKGIIRLNR